MVEGKLSRTFTKPWTAQDGRKLILHSFKLEEFPDEFFRTGTKALNIKEGSVISFEPDDKNNVKPENVTLISASPVPAAQAPQAQTAAKATSSSGGMNRETYWDEKAKADEDRQKSITYQSSRNAAIETVKALVAVSGLALPTETQAREAVLLAAIDSYTERFLEDTARLAPPKNTTPVAETPKKRGRPAKAKSEEPADEAYLG